MAQFLPYDPRGEQTRTHRNLPHWQQPGATYFITFRLGDSLPFEVRKRYAELRELDEEEAFAWVDRYLDAGSGSCIFSEPKHCAMIAACLRHFDGERYDLGAFVVMPNHVHALVQPAPQFALTAIAHNWKSFTAHVLQKTAGLFGQVWQEESFDRIVRDEAELRRFHAYILANPSVANLPPRKYFAGEGSAQWLAT